MRKRLFCAILIASCVFSQIQFPSLAAEGDSVHINTAEEFYLLTEQCRSENFSTGKTFYLDSDLDLSAYENLFLPVMDGTFDGNGHQITGISLSEEVSDYGLFRYVGENGVIRNLTVEAQIVSGEDQENLGILAGDNAGSIFNCTTKGTLNGQKAVGGITGRNEATGDIRRCTNEAKIDGKDGVGGIAGENEGTISDCTNSGNINTSQKVLKELSGDGSINISVPNAVAGLTSDERANETGGIAGNSSGTISYCKNTGTIGYEHLGNATGGIVGRQSGSLSWSSNEGNIYGRKNIGGIVGYFEPYEADSYDRDFSQELDDQLDDLSDLVDGLQDAGDRLGDHLSDNLDELSEQMKDFRSSLRNHLDDFMDLTDDSKDEINDQIDDVKDSLDSLQLDVDLNKLEEYQAKIKEDQAQIESIRQELETMLGSADSDVQEKIQQILTQYEQQLPQINAQLEALEKLIDEKVQEAESAKNSIKDKVDETAGAGDAIKDKVDEAAGNLKDQAENAAGTIKDKVEEAVGDTKKPGDSGTTDQTGDGSSGGATDETGDGSSGGATDETGDGSSGGATDETGDGSSSGATDETGDGSSGGATDQTGDGNSGGATDETGDGGSNGATGETGAGSSSETTDQTEDGSSSGDSSGTDTSASDRTPSGYILVSALQTELTEEQTQQIQAAGEALAKLQQLKELSADIQIQFQGIADILGTIPGEVSDLQSEFKKLENSMEDLVDTIDDELDDWSDELRTTKDDLRSHGNSVSDSLEQTTDTLESDWDVIDDQLRRVKDKFSDIRATISDGFDDLKSTIENCSVYVDISELATSEPGDGKVISCNNTGEIYADSQVGGIVGSITKVSTSDVSGWIFDQDDKDDDDSKDRIIRHVLAAVISCKNTSEIQATDDYAGGIVGRADYGSILSCQNYGDIISEEGSYVGGIAGMAEYSIRDSYVMCGLDGASYVGGVVGSGEDISGSYVCAYMDMEDHVTSSGAVAGKADGTVENNYFVDNDYGAVDGVTRSREATAMDYASLLELGDMPQEFTTFTIRFLDGEEKVWEKTFSYGDEFDLTQYPELTEPEGEYAYWEEKTISPVHRNVTVHAVYRAYIPSLASGGSDEHPDVLLGGEFYPDSAFTVRACTKEEEAQINEMLNKQKLFPRYLLKQIYHYEISQTEPLHSQIDLRVKDTSALADSLLIASDDFQMAGSVQRAQKTGSYLAANMTLGNSGYVIVLDKVSRKTVAAGVTAGAVVLVLAGWLLWRRKHRKTETKETEEKK